MCTHRGHAGTIPPSVNVAFKARTKGAKVYKHRRDHFASGIGLLPKTKGKKLVGIKVVELSRLAEEYPPAGYDIYEADETYAIWDKYRKSILYPDRRFGKTWKPYHKLDPNQLQYTVAEDESVIIRDAKTKEIVCTVIRNFANKEKLLEWINSVIIENSDARKSVRVGISPHFILATI
jgi:hypothetical protein